MIDIKKERLNDLLYTGIAISHDIIDKTNVELEEFKILDKHISILEN
jgi:hypothetical protein